MNINATFFIQIVNFYFFYSMLRVFLFKPAVELIDHDNNEYLALMAIADQQRKSIEIKEKERQSAWNLFREYCKSHVPSFYNQLDVDLSTNQFFDDKDIKDIYVIEPSDIDLLVADVYKKFEEKIKHVH